MVKPLLAAAVLCAVAIMAHACNAQRRPSRDCVCPAVYRPVCGSDGRTYSNGCEANCNGRSVSRKAYDLGEYGTRIYRVTILDGNNLPLS